MAVVAALGLPSCSSSSVDDDVRQGVELRFSASSPESRAALTTAANFNQFQVWGTYRTSGNNTPVKVFDGTKVAKTGASVWSYDDLQYWFPGCRYTFRALHGSDAARFETGADAESDKLVIEGYNAVGGNDLVAASHTRNSLAQGNDVVSLDFKHLLARVDITASVDAAVAGTFVVTSVELLGFNTVGTWSSTGMEGTATPYGVWSLLSGTDKPFQYNMSKTLTTAPQSLLDGANATLMIPQNIPVGAKAKLTYTKDGVAQTVTFDVQKASLSLPNGYQPSRTYRYSFTIGPDDYILFNLPTIQDWEDAEGGNYMPQ